MKAIAYRRGSAADDVDALYDIETLRPEPGPHDLLVRVEAVSVNPLDTKVRKGLVQVPETVGVLGWDASGVVEAVGAAVTLFQPGDEVFYAGSFHLPGSNAEFHLVDERIVGTKPKSIGFGQAAAIPLTALTAWELLFERLGITPEESEQADMTGPAGSILVLGGAGGVGSMLIQLARQLTRLTVIATASHDASADWCRTLGAHHVINHKLPLRAQMEELKAPGVTYIACLSHTEEHLMELIDLVEPHGKLGVIDDHVTFDAAPLKRKSLSLHWEMVFTRAFFGSEDLVEQHRILDRVAALIDAGVIHTTLTTCYTPIDAATLRKAHQLIEEGKVIGKVVVARTINPDINSGENSLHSGE